jgi:hypothetical protein
VVKDPVQSPEATQLVAAVDDQVRVELPPLVTRLGLAASVTVGGLELTDTVAEFVAVPPGPVQARMNCVAALSATVAWLPLVGSGPVQPPEAVHAVALAADQVSVEVFPLFTVEGLAAIVTVGAG